MRRNFSGPDGVFARLHREFIVEPADLRVFFAGGRYENLDEPSPLDLSRGE